MGSPVNLSEFCTTNLIPMKHITISLILGLCVNFFVQAQTTALDFTTTDCSGNPHHLFAELEAGKVVVISYIMLGCSPCIVGTTNLKGLVAGYEATHPGRVKLYSFGYLDSYTCAQMQNWKSTNNFQHPMFTGGESQVAYYGGMGMPTIVVLAKDNHEVLYKKLGFLISDKPAITAAIEEGLAWSPSAIDESLSAKGIEVFPTITENEVILKSQHNLNGLVEIFNVQGMLVKSQILAEVSQVTVSLQDLESGLYVVAIRDEKDYLGSVRIVKK